MTDTRQYIGFGEVEKFLVKSYKCITGGREFDIDKYGPYVDAVKHVLVPSLEKQILFCLERFVYNEDFQRSTYQPYLNGYKESVLTAYAKYNELGTFIETMRDSFTMDQLVDFFGHSLLTNSRLEKISSDLDKMGIERNWLGYVNVLNFINEKDFWVRSSSSSISTRQYSSICSPSNFLSEFNTEDSHLVERTRGQKRPRKRAATHISRKHYKLERVAQLSDRPFRVTKSFYDQLKRSWDFNESLHTKRKLKRKVGGSTFANYRRKNQTTDWKNETLALLARKMTEADKTCVDNEDKKHTEVRTCLALPCRVEQLLTKLERVDSSLARARYHCSFIKRKFQTKLYNVCSCLNNLLSRLDCKTINTVYLVCEIREDYLNFKLKNSRQLFSARVMTCESLYRHGIKRDESRGKLKSQSFWAAKKAEELFRDTKRCQNVKEPISSIEISFSECKPAGATTDRQNVIKELACDPKDLEGPTLRGSSSINDVMQKLELSPFRLRETEQSFMMRSKIRDIVRSIMICTRQNSPRGQEVDLSISIQSVVSNSSLHGTENEEKVLPVDSKPSKSSTVSLIASEICSSRSKDTLPRTDSSKSKKSVECKSCKSVVPKSFIRTREDSLRTGGSVKSDKSRASSSSRDCKPNNKNKRYKVCETWKVPTRSKEFTGSCGCPLSKNMVQSIAFEISNALARTKSIGNGKNDKIDVTVEIEESSESSDDITNSISRHTHLLPSMRSVRVGTSRKYFRDDSETSTSSSSDDKICIQDNFTSMNKSMISSSNRGTISAESYDRIKHLIREKVRKKCSDVDSCQPNSSKTIVSSGKYYLSIPSSKTSRVRLRREISESSSTSHDSLQLSVCNRRRRIRRTSSSIDKNSPRILCDCYSADSETSTAAAFDKNSIYGCIEDRLVNRHLRDIVDDYSDEAGDSPRYRNVESQVSSDFGLCSDEKERLMSRYYDSEISSENDSSFRQVHVSEDEGISNVGIYSQTDFEDSLSPRLGDYQTFERTQRPRRACGWSTCAIKPSNSVECPVIYPVKINCRSKTRDSPRLKIFDFDTINVIEKYKKRFRNIDKNFRTKFLQYVGYCKNIKNHLRKQICIDDIYGTSRTSISSSTFCRHKCSGVYFGG